MRDPGGAVSQPPERLAEPIESLRIARVFGEGRLESIARPRPIRLGKPHPTVVRNRHRPLSCSGVTATTSPPRSLSALVGRFDADVIDLPSGRARVRLAVRDGDSWDAVIRGDVIELQ